MPQYLCVCVCVSAFRRMLMKKSQVYVKYEISEGLNGALRITKGNEVETRIRCIPMNTSHCPDETYGMEEELLFVGVHMYVCLDHGGIMCVCLYVCLYVKSICLNNPAYICRFHFIAYQDSYLAHQGTRIAIN